MSTKLSKDFAYKRIDVFNSMISHDDLKLKIVKRNNYYAIDYLDNRVFISGLTFKAMCVAVDSIYLTLFLLKAESVYLERQAL